MLFHHCFLKILTAEDIRQIPPPITNITLHVDIDLFLSEKRIMRPNMNINTPPISMSHGFIALFAFFTLSLTLLTAFFALSVSINCTVTFCSITVGFSVLAITAPQNSHFVKLENDAPQDSHSGIFNHKTFRSTKESLNYKKKVRY
ncbi:hypothetical protein M2451_000546 [Dysgonomonas sp. PFB1-18]|nr:hypothetical protein [Dysgonomonas sp. PF1-14]MDH6337315.1 hypothetical protein [Dysgonomonas sp. PF1-16]MDH6379239.1 hypothetical protein [Dysgonomonas sp. PFB1-18]MDH6396123.1 hypothetical protein [Dysgonomonas sp. PF1-23]